jgi:hypothetical protein
MPRRGRFLGLILPLVCATGRDDAKIVSKKQEKFLKQNQPLPSLRSGSAGRLAPPGFVLARRLGGTPRPTDVFFVKQ